MKQLTLLIVLITLVFIKLSAQSEPFTKRTVVTAGMGLNNPWECVYGPGDSLFVTEAKGYIISRISTNTTPGVKTQLLDLTGMKANWNTGTGPQGGLMGLALHPALYSTNAATRYAKPYVYAAFVYAKATPNSTCATPGTGAGCVFSTRIVRYEYRGTALINPVIILDALPGSSDHNSGRLTISPVIEPGSDAAHTQYRLYYTIGDMGCGQFANTNRTENAQVTDAFEGKIYRLNTESDGDAGQDAWIPNDNPFYDGAPITAKDYVYSKGHRNPQGLVWGVVAGTPRLYSSEQSDRADDEINLIVGGNNYGWDKVSGACDGDVNGFQIGQTTVGNEVTNCAGTTQPMFTTFHHNATWPSNYPANGSGNANWPTIAASSVEFYGKNVIPGWPGSLLITPLKDDKVYRLKLNATGTAITGDTISYFRGDGNRIRRITSDPSGLKFYVVRDNNTIMEYTYTGITLPVRLLYFRGILQDNAAQLEWSTSAETNSDHFVIERSLDGVSYTDIGTVKSTGNSSVNNVYNYSDINAVTQQGNIIYYRLRMVDIDGSAKYSNVVSIALSEKVEKISVIPNPVQGVSKVYITVINGGTANWKVVDNSGVVVLQNNLQLKPGANSLSLDMTRLAAGIYYLNVSGPGISQKVKLQKL
jgi:PQQ-dependent dehydrogenase (s-GDH family)